MMGRESRKQKCTHLNSPSFANDLNLFFFNSRHDTRDFNTECDMVCTKMPVHAPLVLTEHRIAVSLACTKPNKAPGPDDLTGQVLKDCALQITGVITQLFQLRLDKSNGNCQL